jgi:chromosome partitioning protein
LDKRYELVMIDAGGRDSKEFRTSLAVANVCLTPFVPSQHEVDTLPLVNDLIEQIKVFNPELTGYAVFSNCPQNKSAREKRINEYRVALKDELTELTLLNTEIINRIAYTDTATNGLGVTEMDDEKALGEIESLYQEIF